MSLVEWDGYSCTVIRDEQPHDDDDDDHDNHPVTRLTAAMLVYEQCGDRVDEARAAFARVPFSCTHDMATVLRSVATARLVPGFFLVLFEAALQLVELHRRGVDASAPLLKMLAELGVAARDPDLIRESNATSNGMCERAFRCYQLRLAVAESSLRDDDARRVCSALEQCTEPRLSGAADVEALCYVANAQRCNDDALRVLLQAQRFVDGHHEDWYPEEITRASMMLVRSYADYMCRIGRPSVAVYLSKRALTVANQDEKNVQILAQCMLCILMAASKRGSDKPTLMLELCDTLLELARRRRVRVLSPSDLHTCAEIRNLNAN